MHDYSNHDAVGHVQRPHVPTAQPAVQQAESSGQVVSPGMMMSLGFLLMSDVAAYDWQGASEMKLSEH